MPESNQNHELALPNKRYFTIGEVSELCAVKPHELRDWEQHFKQLANIKRRGKRRYYQRDDVLIIRQIRSLLNDQGLTVDDVRLHLSGDAVPPKVNQAAHINIIRQIIADLEEILKFLRR